MLKKILTILLVLIFIFSAYKLITDKKEIKEGITYYNSVPSSNNEIPNYVGNIKIDNVLNYPIVQTDNNEYYLTHLPNKEKNRIGSIFMDYRNYKFEDFNTIIYGHSLKEKTMFSSLENYRKKDYFNKHKYVTITTDKTYKYEIISVIELDATKESIPIIYDKNYINKINNNLLNIKVNLKETDKIISLCTCTYSFKNARLVVVAKKI